MPTYRGSHPLLSFRKRAFWQQCFLSFDTCISSQPRYNPILSSLRHCHLLHKPSPVRRSTRWSAQLFQKPSFLLPRDCQSSMPGKADMLEPSPVIDLVLPYTIRLITLAPNPYFFPSASLSLSLSLQLYPSKIQLYYTISYPILSITAYPSSPTSISNT